MKKTTLCSLGLLGMSACLINTAPVFASETQPVAASESTVLFAADDEQGPNIVTPPGEGGDGGEVDPGGSDGNTGDGNKSFNIDWVSNFRFNETNPDGTFQPITLNGNGMDLWAKGTKLALKDAEGTVKTYENIPNFVQITDNRGNANGWHLTVSRTEFSGKDAAGVEQTLNGATLLLNNQHIFGPEGVTKPTSMEGQAVEIGAATKNLMTAAVGAGTGSWTLAFGDEDDNGQLVADTGVELQIPASAQPKANVTYKADLTWTLSDTPVF